MKSQLPDRKLHTSCKNCMFAIYDNCTQTGCAANRINKFDKSVIIEAYDNEKEFYVINQFCNLYRPLSWNNGQIDLPKALNESALDFHVLIDCDSINTNFKDYILESIQQNAYNKDKLNIELFHNDGASAEIKSLVLDIYSKCRGVKISVCVDSAAFLHETALKSKQVCHLVVRDDSFDFENLNSLNNAVNQDLKKFICASSQNSVIISNMAYKINYYKSLINKYDTNITSLINTSKEIGMHINF